MGAMRVTGRKSGSVLGNPRVLLAPRAPYRPAAGGALPRGGGSDGSSSCRSRSRPARACP